MTKVMLPKRKPRLRRPKPSILTHPNIPRPLHGTNPRTIMGKEWWDKVRKKAYASNNHHCHACGVHRHDAKYLQRLEAHEIYKINYKTCRMKFQGVVALCHFCHAVIHSGRTTQVYFSGKISESKFKRIVEHGLSLHAKYRLKPTYAFRFMTLIYQGYRQDEAIQKAAKEFPAGPEASLKDWNKWRLEFDGKLYKPHFKNEEQWYNHYHQHLPE